MIRFLFALFLISFCSPTMADDLTVYPNGSGTYPTIQSAIDACSPGDRVLLAPGVYVGAGNNRLDVANAAFNILESVTGIAEDCIVDCQNAAFMRFLDTGVRSELAISAITITNSGNAAFWWFDRRALRLQGCVYRNNNCGLGSLDPGLVAERFEIIDCRLVDNNVSGSTSSLLAGFTVERSIISNNVFPSLYYGVVPLVLADCLIVDNQATSSLIHVFNGETQPSILVERCIFFNNSSSLFIERDLDNFAYFRNCVIASNPYVHPYEFTDTIGLGSFVVENCCIFGNGLASNNVWEAFQNSAATNFDVDPLFCAPYSGDFRLCSNSICLATNNGSNDIGIIIGECGSCGPVPIEGRSWGSVQAMFR